MIKVFLNLSVVFLLLLFLSCSSSEETSNNDNASGDDSGYVFDEIPPDDQFNIESPEEEKKGLYIIQIGAFSSEDKAEEFLRESSKKLKDKLIVEYSDRVNLYTVRLAVEFKSKKDAEKKRNELWKINGFNDAWILEKEE